MHDVNDWQHDHDFTDASQRDAARRTYWVIALTSVTMVVELVAGFWTGSMALLADGWHMATHVGALSIAAFAYYLTQRYAQDPRFTFGTGKIATLGGFTSAVVLGIVSLLLVIESIDRLIEPQPVRFAEAMLVAWIGLAVNLLSAWLLGHARDTGDHAHHGHNHLHHDHNLRGAYLHVLADALTSVLAIVALWAGWQFGWVWMDPAVGIIGAIVISRWAYGLLRDTGAILIDAEDCSDTERQIRAAIETHPDKRIADLHVWRVGPRSLACIVSLVTHQPGSAAVYKALLAGIDGLEHVTIEVNHCTPEVCPEISKAF